jgi:hypothetical protein
VPAATSGSHLYLGPRRHVGVVVEKYRQAQATSDQRRHRGIVQRQIRRGHDNTAAQIDRARAADAHREHGVTGGSRIAYHRLRSLRDRPHYRRDVSGAAGHYSRLAAQTAVAGDPACSDLRAADIDTNHDLH